MKFNSIGKNLSHYLAQIGMTQKELAEESGLTQPAISMICNGKRDPSLQSLYKILNVMGLKFEELMK